MYTTVGFGVVTVGVVGFGVVTTFVVFAAGFTLTALVADEVVSPVAVSIAATVMSASTATSFVLRAMSIIFSFAFVKLNGVSQSICW